MTQIPQETINNTPIKANKEDGQLALEQETATASFGKIVSSQLSPVVEVYMTEYFMVTVQAYPRRFMVFPLDARETKPFCVTNSSAPGYLREVIEFGKWLQFGKDGYLRLLPDDGRPVVI